MASFWVKSTVAFLRSSASLWKGGAAGMRSTFFSSSMAFMAPKPASTTV